MTLSSDLRQEVRVSARDIDRYLTAQGSQLFCLRALSLYDVQSWDIRIVSEGFSGNTLILEASGAFDPIGLLDGRIPELLCSSSVEMSWPGGSVTFDQPLDQAQRDDLRGVRGQNATATTLVKFKSFFGGSLEPDWMNEEELRLLLRNLTWMGSLRYRESPYRVNVHCLGHSFGWKPKQVAERGDEHVVLLGDYELRLLRRDSKITNFRHAMYGTLDAFDELETLRRGIKRAGLAGCLVELPVQFPIELGPLGALVPAEPLADLVADLAARFESNRAVYRLGIEVERNRRNREAADLNVRIEDAKAARRVLLRGEVVGSEPISEYGLVSLVHKLEGLNAIPLPTYRTVSWTTAQGIDALGTLQIESYQPIKEFAFIEFEFELNNFFKHDHSPEHVELIVCWRLGNTSRSLERRYDWLYFYDVSSKKIPILVVSRIPHLTMQF